MSGIIGDGILVIFSWAGGGYDDGRSVDIGWWRDDGSVTLRYSALSVACW
jgi:hypothetical protein